MATVEVNANIKTKPAVRHASFEVELTGRGKITAAINVKDVRLSFPSGTVYIGKTLADFDTLAALIEAARGELIEQGVTE